MAVYTNSFQDIMHIYDHDCTKLTYEQKLVKLCDYIFDFNYDYKNDLTFKAFFEPYFIEHFFNEEFAFETLDYFKVKLKNRMQEVLPFYIPLYQTFYINTIDLTLIEKEESSEKGGNDESGKTIVILLQLITRLMYRVTCLLMLFLLVTLMMSNMLLTASGVVILQRMKATLLILTITYIHVIAVVNALITDLTMLHGIQVNF